MIEFHAVERRFPGGTLALSGVSFAIPRGQFCVVLGASGAGKSTLLRCLNGLATPTAGKVVIDSTPVTRKSLRVLRPRIGMIHQSFALVERASVAHNVVAGALPRIATVPALLGLIPREYQRKACQLLSEVGLGEEHLARRASALSGGQQQRVGIARAFMLEPDIILADEPVASLDPTTSRDILALIKDEAETRGATALCSLHQLDLAQAFADRIVALKAGRIVFDGPPDALTRDITDQIYGSTRYGAGMPPP
jgi:phosphonate transport system ATP-binding protein